MKRTAIHPAHADLPKMNDHMLAHELEYTLQQINATKSRLDNAISMLKHCRQPDLPLWCLRIDLSAHLSRFEAVTDEIRYRNDAMR